jgi:hypothetical protein
MSKKNEWALIKFDDGEFDKISIREILPQKEKVQIKKKCKINYKSKQHVVTVMMIGSKRDVEERLNFLTVNDDEDQETDDEQTIEEDNASEVETTRNRNKRKHTNETTDDETDSALFQKRPKASSTQIRSKSSINMTPYSQSALLNQSEVYKNKFYF